LHFKGRAEKFSYFEISPEVPARPCGRDISERGKALGSAESKVDFEVHLVIF
jgi:hypothetical protein